MLRDRLTFDWKTAIKEGDTNIINALRRQADTQHVVVDWNPEDEGFVNMVENNAQAMMEVGKAPQALIDINQAKVEVSHRAKSRISALDTLLNKLHEHKTGCSLGGCSQHHRALSAMEVVKAMVQTNMSISIAPMASLGCGLSHA